MTDDSKAIVLLCGTLGDRPSPDDATPLSPAEYATLARWLLANDLRPADLLTPDVLTRAAAAHAQPADAQPADAQPADASTAANATAAHAADTPALSEPRLAALLDRGVQLGFALERWTQSGLWVLSRADPDYPARVRAHLRDAAPPVFYGAGDQALLAGGGGGESSGGSLAILGSRNTDEAGHAFAKSVATWCAHHGTPVVTNGDARHPLHQTVLTTALENSAPVTAVLAAGLLAASVTRNARQGLAAGNLLLISPSHPESRATAAAARAATPSRDALIYALADYALVVSTRNGKGDTWEAATAELQRDPARPVFVRTTGSPPPGNAKLLARGAIAVPEIAEDTDPHTVLARAAADSTQPPAVAQDLFDFVKGTPSPPTVDEGPDA